MKRRILSPIVIMGLLALMAVTIAPTANAALPINLSWVKFASNPVVRTGMCQNGLTPTGPAVVVESADNYKMYFTTYPGADGAAIWLAETTNGGQSWTCHGTAPVLSPGSSGAWDDTRVTGPSVIKDDGYKMWYSGRNSQGVYGIGYATSADGITWVKAGSTKQSLSPVTAWDSSMIRNPSVLKVDATYHMWYEGTNRWPYFKIGHATSTDGISWTKDAANPVLSPTSGSWDSIETYAPSVVYNPDDALKPYEMFYSGNSGGHWSTGHATSADGIAWTKGDNAIITNSATGWDSEDSADYAAGVLDGQTWKVFYSGAGSSGYQIGLATLMNQPQLTFRKATAAVAVGQNVDIYIDLTAATNLYGYQFNVNYDASKLDVATVGYENSFFDTAYDAFPLPATCSAGVCHFAVTKQAVSPVSGSGPLAKITFTGKASGTTGISSLTFSGDILANRDGASLAHSTTTGWIDVLLNTAVSGRINLQGRSTPIDASTVTLYPTYGYVVPTSAFVDPASGDWSATVPVQGGATAYDIIAAHTLYLTNQNLAVSITSLPITGMNTTLKGGDANNDGVIEVGDLTCIGGNFGGAVGTCGGTGSSDINHDSYVNILDLVLVGGNYGLRSPQLW